MEFGSILIDEINNDLASMDPLTQSEETDDLLIIHESLSKDKSLSVNFLNSPSDLPTNRGKDSLPPQCDASLNVSNSFCYVYLILYII